MQGRAQLPGLLENLPSPAPHVLELHGAPRGLGSRYPTSSLTSIGGHHVAFSQGQAGEPQEHEGRPHLAGRQDRASRLLRAATAPFCSARGSAPRKVPWLEGAGVATPGRVGHTCCVGSGVQGADHGWLERATCCALAQRRSGHRGLDLCQPGVRAAKGSGESAEALAVLVVRDPSPPRRARPSSPSGSPKVAGRPCPAATHTPSHSSATVSSTLSS